MTKKCIIPNCRLEDDDPGHTKLHFFRVPKNEDRKKQWSENIKSYFNKDVEFKKFSYICDLHFKQDCFYYTGCNILRLKNGSCPTIFSDYATRGQEDSIENFTNKNDSKVISSSTFHHCLINSEQISDPLNVSMIPSLKNENVNFYSSGPSICDQQSEQYDVEINDIQKRYNNLHNVSPGSSVNNACDDYETIDAASSASVQSNKSFDNINDSARDRSKKNVLNKSVVTLDLDAINYQDKILVRKIIQNAQKEVRKFHKNRGVQAMRLYRAKKKMKNIDNLISRMKQRKKVSEKVSEILRVSEREFI